MKRISHWLFDDPNRLLICFYSLGVFLSIPYFINMVKLILSLDGEITAMILTRIAGVFAPPLGFIMGFF